MKIKLKGLKLNNSGYSIVEVIVAVIILSIVAVPLLNTFITSIRVNTKAKELQRATSAAESLMEGCKAYSFNDILDQFTSGSVSVYENADASDVLSTSVNYIDEAATNNVGTSLTAKTYSFGLKNMNYKGSIYDAKITIKPYKSSSGNAYQGIKNMKYIERMNGYKDAIYLQSLDDISNSYFSLLSDIAIELNSVDKVYGYTGEDPDRGIKPNMLDTTKIDFKRDTVVTIEDKKVHVKITYNATTNSYPYYNNSGNIEYLSYSAAPVIKDIDVYNTTGISEAGAEIENVFLFLYPVYHTTLSGYDFLEDKYNISYSGTREVNVFFVKQYNSMIANANISNYKLCEHGYSPDGTCSNVKLFHNLSENLADGSSTSIDPTHVFSVVNSAEIIKGISYLKDETIIYDVKIGIYPSGEFDNGFLNAAIFELEGTMYE